MIKLIIAYAPLAIAGHEITYSRSISLKKGKDNMMVTTDTIRENILSTSELHTSLLQNKEVRMLHEINADYVTFYYKENVCEFLFFRNKQFHSLEYMKAFSFTEIQYKNLEHKVRRFNHI